MPVCFLPPATQPRMSMTPNVLAWESHEEDSIHRLKVWKHFLPFPTIHTQSQKLPLILLISKTHFVQMFSWGLRVNTNIENLKLRKGLAFWKSTSMFLGDSVTVMPGAPIVLPFGLSNCQRSPSLFRTTVLQFWPGWAEDFIFIMGSRMLANQPSFFLWLEETLSLDKHLPMFSMYSIVYTQQVANVHEDRRRPSAAWRPAATQRGRDVSFVLPEPPIQCWLLPALHPFSPFSEIPLASRFVLKCLFSESLLFAKWEGMVLHPASIILCYPPPCFQQVEYVHKQGPQFPCAKQVFKSPLWGW